MVTIKSEPTIETITIGNKVMNLGDFCIVGRNCNTHLVTTQWVITKANKIEDERFIYLRDFDAFMKAVHTLDKQYESICNCIDFYEPMLGTENLDDVEKEVLKQEYDKKYCYEWIEEAFRGYKSALALKPRIEFFQAINTEEKYRQYLVELVQANLYKTGREFYDAVLFYLDLDNDKFNILHSKERIKRGKKEFIKLFVDNKVTIEQLQIFIVYCNCPKITKLMEFFFEDASGMTVKELTNKMIDMEKYLNKLGR